MQFFRLTIRSVLFIETLAVASFAVAYWLFPAPVAGSSLIMIPTFAAVSVLFHTPVALLKGWDFRIWDEAAESCWRRYWFVAIFVAGFFSPWLAGLLRGYAIN